MFVVKSNYEEGMLIFGVFIFFYLKVALKTILILNVNCKKSVLGSYFWKYCIFRLLIDFTATKYL